MTPYQSTSPTPPSRALLSLDGALVTRSRLPGASSKCETMSRQHAWGQCRTGHREGTKIMKEPASHGDGRALAANVEKEPPVSPNKATDPTSEQNSPLIPSVKDRLCHSTWLLR